MRKRPFILGVGGTLRANSTSEALLCLAIAEAEAAGADVEIIAGPRLVMPLYDSYNAERVEQASYLVQRLRKCDGVILSSPGYHGSISGLMKNALDYTEDLARDERPYLDGRAVGCIACGAGWQGAAATLAALRAIVFSLRGWPTPMGGMASTTTKIFASDGSCLDAKVGEQMRIIGRQVTQFAYAQMHGRKAA